MATKTGRPDKGKQLGREKVLGRSALTGRYVMKPSTESSVSSEKLKSAVRSASQKKR
jgi:hypothetical protein